MKIFNIKDLNTGKVIQRFDLAAAEAYVASTSGKFKITCDWVNEEEIEKIIKTIK